MQVAKWGNGLAVRIPADVALELDLKEGDEVRLRALESGELAVITERQRRRDIVESFRKFRGMMPADFKFNRDEANDRGSD